jgi:hypothetical protein
MSTEYSLILVLWVIFDDVMTPWVLAWLLPMVLLYVYTAQNNDDVFTAEQSLHQPSYVPVDSCLIQQLTSRYKDSEFPWQNYKVGPRNQRIISFKRTGLIVGRLWPINHNLTAQKLMIEASWTTTFLMEFHLRLSLQHLMCCINWTSISRISLLLKMIIPKWWILDMSIKRD